MLQRPGAASAKRVPLGVDVPLRCVLDGAAVKDGRGANLKDKNAERSEGAVAARQLCAERLLDALKGGAQEKQALADYAGVPARALKDTLARLLTIKAIETIQGKLLVLSAEWKAWPALPLKGRVIAAMGDGTGRQLSAVRASGGAA